MKDKRNCHDTVGKSSLEQNFRKSIAIIRLLCEISGALHLAELDLMAGRLAGRRQAGRQNTGEFRNFQSWL